MNRRSIIKSVGAVSAISGISQGAIADRSDGEIKVTGDDTTTDEPENNWPYEDTFEWEGFDGYLAEFKGSLATSVAYFGSTYVDSRDSWYHDFRFVTTVGSELTNPDEADPLTTKWVNDQWYDISSSSLEWAETTKEEHFGAWPVGDEDGAAIDLGSPAIEAAGLAISAINPTIGFSVGAASLVGSMLNTGSQTEDGLSMEHRHENCGPVSCGSDEVEEMGHHKRVFAVQESTPDTCPVWKPCKDRFTIETGVKVRPEFQRPSPSLEMKFEVDGHDGNLGPLSQSVSDIEDLSERQLKELGIKRVEIGSRGEVSSETVENLSQSEADMLSRFAAEDDTVYFTSLQFDSELETDTE